MVRKQPQVAKRAGLGFRVKGLGFRIAVAGNLPRGVSRERDTKPSTITASLPWRGAHGAAARLLRATAHARKSVRAQPGAAGHIPCDATATTPVARLPTPPFFVALECVLRRLRELSKQLPCVFITAGPITKLCAWGRRIVEDMCYEVRRAEACVD